MHERGCNIFKGDEWLTTPENGTRQNRKPLSSRQERHRGKTSQKPAYARHKIITGKGSLLIVGGYTAALRPVKPVSVHPS
jgi:hypothetical protein